MKAECASCSRPPGTIVSQCTDKSRLDCHAVAHLRWIDALELKINGCCFRRPSQRCTDAAADTGASEIGQLLPHQWMPA